MILDTLENAGRYAGLHPLFARAFAFLRETDFSRLAPGRYPVEGDALFAIVEESGGRTREEAKLECHRKYIDIHLVLAGEEHIGWKPLGACREQVSEYSEPRDVAFYIDQPANWAFLSAGTFCVFFPEDAHAPLVAAQPIRKAVMKIAVDVAETGA